jgi:cysteine desulfuration protein SufE
LIKIDSEARMDIATIEEEIAEEFAMFPDWQDKYQYIIDLGKDMKGLPESAQTEENKVRGCQSNVWLTAQLQNGLLYFEGDSDALIVKGLVALVLRVLSGHSPDEILEAKLSFMDITGLQGHLSPTRNNGLAAMIKQIRYYAIAYKAKSNV